MISLAIIGTGIMANSHANQFLKIKGVKLVGCCDVNRERAQAFAVKWQIPGVYTDYRRLLGRGGLDGVVNVTPDAMHAEISLAALARKIPILCEKPLATNLADAKKMAAAAKKARVVNMVNFSYRNSCGLQAAAKAIAAGAIGRPIHVESSYLQSWLVSKAWGDWRTDPGWTWRLSTRHGSAGTLGDVGCHIYDLTTLLAGEIGEIHCRQGTFDKGMRGNRLGPYVLDANDSFVANVVFRNGAMGTVHSTRWAVGQLNSLRCRIFGDEGGIEVDLDKGYDIYQICRGRKNIDAGRWETVKCKPTPSMAQRFVTALRTGKADPSDFANGAKIQAYLHYSILSDKLARPVKIVGL